MAQARIDCDVLSRQVDEDRPWYDWTPNPIFHEASRILAEISCGDLIDVWYGVDDTTPRVKNSGQQTLGFEALSRGNQDQVCLSLCLAAVSAFSNRGLEMPMLLDDVFVNIDQRRTTATINAITDFSDRGHQVILFTCHEHIANQWRVRNTPVFELPQTATEPAIVPSKFEPLPRTTERRTDATMAPPVKVSTPCRVAEEKPQRIFRYPSDNDIRRVIPQSPVSRVTRTSEPVTVISDRTSLRLVQLFEPTELVNLKRCGVQRQGTSSIWIPEIYPANSFGIKFMEPIANAGRLAVG